LDEAIKFVGDNGDWDEEKSLSDTRDEISLISFLLEQPMRIDTQSATVERSAGELVMIAMLLRLGEWNINDRQANERLKRNGMKVEENYLIVSNSDMNIQKMLIGTPWAKNHSKILMRLPGAKKTSNNQRFASGVATRAVMIPKETLFPGMKPETALPPPADAITEVSKPVNDQFSKPQEDLPF
jgi:hypothetical protein